MQTLVIGIDANYLPKAVVFYESLLKYYKNFVLHVFCFDDVTYESLKVLRYKKVILHKKSDFESKKLLELRKSKKKTYEYYWAVNAYITKYVLDNYQPESVTFTDCDCMFFDSPKKIFDEVKGADILIQPNNFSFLSVNDFIPVGYYCSSFELFRSNENGVKVLNWWNKACMKWCSASFEDGKFGDQKYLDDWRERFKKVREVTNPGANVAPWNVQKYDLIKKDGKIFLNGVWPLVHYHFHSFRMNFDDYNYIITGDRENYYKLSKRVVDAVYKPYISAMKSAIKKLKKTKSFSSYILTNPKGLQIGFDGKVIKKYSHT